jgi:hypothetical protein
MRQARDRAIQVVCDHLFREGERGGGQGPLIGTPHANLPCSQTKSSDIRGGFRQFALTRETEALQEILWVAPAGTQTLSAYVLLVKLDLRSG